MSKLLLSTMYSNKSISPLFPTVGKHAMELFTDDLKSSLSAGDQFQVSAEVNEVSLFHHDLMHFDSHKGTMVKLAHLS